MEKTYRIATFGLCDPGYSEELADRQHKAAVDELRKTFSDIVDAGLQTDENKSPDAVAMLAKADAEKPFDVIFVVQAAWSRPPVFLQLLRAFPDKPMVLYSPGSPVENGVIRSIAPAAGATASINILKRHKVFFKYVYSAPATPVKADDFMPFVRAAHARRMLSGSRIGMVGFGDMRLQNTGFDIQELHERLGVEVESIDMLEIWQEMQKISDRDAQALAQKLTAPWSYHGQRPSGEIFDKMIRFFAVFERWAGERKISALSIKCPTGVTKTMGFTPCLVGCLLSRKYHYVCENDVPGALTQLVLGLISSQTTTYWEFYEILESSILFGCCGFVPENFLDEPFKVRTLEGFMTGMACCSRVKPGKYTIARVGKDPDGRYNIYFTDGMAADSPAWYEDCAGLPKHPSVAYSPKVPVKTILEVVTAQHVAVTPGNWTRELAEFAKMAGIKKLTADGSEK